MVHVWYVLVESLSIGDCLGTRKCLLSFIAIKELGSPVAAWLIRFEFQMLFNCACRSSPNRKFVMGMCETLLRDLVGNVADQSSFVLVWCLTKISVETTSDEPTFAKAF